MAATQDAKATQMETVAPTATTTTLEFAPESLLGLDWKLPAFESEAAKSAEAQRLIVTLSQNNRDFNAWVALIKILEKSASSEDIKAAYHALLDQFPLCWGYWKRLAQLECRTLGVDAATATYERAIEVAEACPDLWIHYLDMLCNSSNAVKDAKKIDETRRVFDRAVNAVGKNWHAAPLWNKYMDFEEANSEWRRLGELFRRALAIPMDGLTAIHARFRALLVGDFTGRSGADSPKLQLLCTVEEAKIFAAAEAEIGMVAKSGIDPSHMLQAELPELAESSGVVDQEPQDAQACEVVSRDGKIQHENDGKIQHENDSKNRHEPVVTGTLVKGDEAQSEDLEEGEIAEDGEIVEDDEEPGECSVSKHAPQPVAAKHAFAAAAAVFKAAKRCAETEDGDDKRVSQKHALTVHLNESADYSRGRCWLLSERTKLYEQTSAEMEQLRRFESNLTRPYFHEEPLSSDEVQTWRSYLAMEESREPRDHQRLRALFERCLVAANNYLEFWLRFATFLESLSGPSDALRHLTRACASGRLRARPDALAALAELEEQCGRPQRARELLDAALLHFPRNGCVPELALRRVALELRSAGSDATATLLRRFLAEAPAAQVASVREALAMRHAQLCEGLLERPEEALEEVERAWNMGCRSASFVTDYASLLIRRGRGRPDALAAASKLFETTLAGADDGRGENARDLTALWGCYVDLLVTYGAPVAQLRSVQLRARRFLACANAAAGAPKTPGEVAGQSGQKRTAPMVGASAQGIAKTARIEQQSRSIAMASKLMRAQMVRHSQMAYVSAFYGTASMPYVHAGG